MSGKTLQRLTSELVIPGRAGQIAKEQLAKLRADFEQQPRFGYPWTKCTDCERHECAGDCEVAS